VRQGPRIVAKADANSRTARLVTLTRDAGTRWRSENQLVAFRRGQPFQEATQAVTRAWRDSLIRRLGPERIIGQALSPIDARDAVSRRSEADLGDIVADAMRIGTGADIGMINSGTLRLDDIIAAGPISNYTLESIFLFSDETRVVTFPLTGARLRELLEHSVSDAGLGHGAFLQVSGVAFRYDKSKPSGSRIVGDLVRPNGTPIAPPDQVRVSFDVYPACTGGDGYIVPEAATACRSATSAPRTVDLLIAHVERQLNGRVPVPPKGRVVPVQ
jgi:hypothetical protein